MTRSKAMYTFHVPHAGTRKSSGMLGVTFDLLTMKSRLYTGSGGIVFRKHHKTLIMWATPLAEWSSVLQIDSRRA